MPNTIYSLATPQGVGAISIIRVSGDKSLDTLQKIFKGEIEDHKLCYGDLVYEDKLVDSCMCVYMKAPRTYTREDVVEFHIHGGNAIVRQLLDILAKMGLSQAEPGEFTKRAFLNGRIDLTQGEAVMEMINSTSDMQKNIAAGQLKGSVEKFVKELSDNILDTLAKLDVCIDYPEEDIETETMEAVKQDLQQVMHKIETNVSSKLAGQIVSEGYKIAIVGRPNVGKSSLLNAILGKDRVIVTDIPGTTRDTLKESYIYKDMMFTFVDTAGIRESEDVVENIGIERSFEAMDEANLVLALFDGSETLTEEDERVLKAIEPYKHMIIVNKNDKDKTSSVEGLSISAKEGVNIEVLLDKIYEQAQNSMGNIGIITNNRHTSLCHNAISHFNQAIDAIDMCDDVECVEIHIREGWHKLCEITGAYYDEDIISRIFEKFCLGK